MSRADVSACASEWRSSLKVAHRRDGARAVLADRAPASSLPLSATPGRRSVKNGAQRTSSLHRSRLPGVLISGVKHAFDRDSFLF